MKYLELNKFVHRDLACRNCMWVKLDVVPLNRCSKSSYCLEFLKYNCIGHLRITDSNYGCSAKQAKDIWPMCFTLPEFVGALSHGIAVFIGLRVCVCVQIHFSLQGKWQLGGQSRWFWIIARHLRERLLSCLGIKARSSGEMDGGRKPGNGRIYNEIGRRMFWFFLKINLLPLHSVNGG